MIKKIFMIILVGLFMARAGFLPAVEVLQLEGLIKEARQNNPDILAAKKRWEASVARVPQAKSLENPSVGLTFEKIPRGTLKLNKTMSDDRMLTINQAIPFLSKLSLRGKIALVESQMLASDYKNKELEVINELKNAYYDLFMNYKEIELSQESLFFLEGIARIAEAKYIVGELMQEGIFKINSEIARLSNNIENLKKEKFAKITRINSLLNREPESPLGIPELNDDTTFNKDINSLYKFTLENQPELLIFSYAIEKNKYAKSLAKRSLLPDLMTGMVLRGITAGSIGPWDLMLSLSLPLWFWTKQRYEIKEAIANLEEAQASYQAMKNKALAETKDLFTKVEIARGKIDLYKDTQIPLLESSLEASLAAYRSGEGDIMMLLDSQRMLIEARMLYYKSLVEYNMYLADLERTVGIDLTEVKR